MYSAVAGAINHPDALNPYQALFNFRMLDALSEAGVDLDTVSPRPFAPPIGPYSSYRSIPLREQWGPYTLHHPRFWYLLPKRLLYAASGESYARRVPAYLERELAVPDVIHACHIYPDGYGLLPYANAHDLPLFVVAHGKLLNNLGDLPPTVDGKVRETLDEAAGVLCVSEALEAEAARHTDPSKVTTVPIGADPEKFPVDEQSRLRAELGIDPDATVVLFVGQFTERKGIEELATVLPDLDLDSTEFVFVGHGGELEEELKRAVADSGFSNRHVYTGVTSLALRRWHAIADLLVLPSHAEGRPTVIYEAMASETAVLASNVDGIPEQVADGETGVLIPPKDLPALRGSLETLTADRERLREMGEAGLERLRANDWTWASHAERVTELHRAALETATPVDQSVPR
ncbi:glycosyltransferase [Halovenus sp. WSH3]|uniref:Glycosyltransferase n=1 Tax=Halovenus carboxidivorans TaxID=2692199 RepID=A0A6B0TIG3_9EURY|nr:glycosyltransferase [Halovenus carboxidivorans]MXR52999.1 glycosyltransferase [Halovenus carboxidivorans]